MKKKFAWGILKTSNRKISSNALSSGLERAVLVEYLCKVCIIIANIIFMCLNFSSYNSDSHNQHALDKASCDCTSLDFYTEVFFF